MLTVSELYGPLSVVTPATGYAVSVDQAKRQCRVDLAEDDTDFQSLIKQAAAFVEGEIYGNRTLLLTTFDLPVRDFWCWPECDGLRLPRPPLSSVTSITYYDTAGTSQTLATSYYNVRTPWSQPGRIERKPNVFYPPCQTDRPYPVTIRFVAGYIDGSTATAAQIEAAIPPQVTRAMLLAIRAWYDDPGIIGKDEQRAIDDLLGQCGWGSYA